MLLAVPGTAPHYIAGHVLFGLSAICTCLIGLATSVARRLRDTFTERERDRWSALAAAMGSIDLVWGIAILAGGTAPYRIAPGFVLIGLGLACFSIVAKVLLLALVWRRTLALVADMPLVSVFTALSCLFTSAFVFAAATADGELIVPARVLVGLGAVCFTLFSIISILEVGTSGDAEPTS